MNSNEFNNNKNCIIWVKDIDYYIFEGTILYSKLPDSYRIIVDKDTKEEDIEDEYYNDLIMIEGNKSENNNKPTVIEANMTIKDNKTEIVKDTTINNGGNSVNNVGSGNLDNSTNDNRIITNIENQYNYKTINRIINKIPEDKPIKDYRDILIGIQNETRKSTHVFTGFVNLIKGSKSAVICNLMWKRRTYVCNHIYVFNNIRNLEVGDYVRFVGTITPYTRGKDNSEDIGIKIVEITNIIKPEKYITFVELNSNDLYNPNRSGYLANLSYNELALFYDRQITKIKYVVETNGIYSIEIYEAIIQTVFFEATKEYDMYKNNLMMDDCEITPDYVKYVCLVRYLTCECNIISPFMIYTLLCLITKRPKKKILNPHFYYNRQHSIKNAGEFNITEFKIHDMNLYSIPYLNKYISEFISETDNDAPIWRLDN